MDGICAVHDGLKGSKGEPGFPGDAGKMFFIYTKSYWNKLCLLLGTPGQRGPSGEKGERGNLLENLSFNWIHL